MRKVGYLRVSTAEQRPDRQVAGLSDLCDELHIETLSAVAARRPIYEKVAASLMPGDALVVWDFDRAFRSVEDALAEMRRLRARGVGIEIVGLNVDTDTPAGHFMITMMAAAAEFERRMLVKRTKEGLAAARERGVRLGRPPKLSEVQIQEASRRLSIPGTTIKCVAEELGIAPWSLTRAIRRQSRAVHAAESDLASPST